VSIRKAAMATLIAGSMIVVPTIAQAAQANQTAVSKLSIRSAQVRGGAVMGKKERIQGGSAIIFLGAILAAAGAGYLIRGGGSSSP
jgi:hypothetical protein